MVAWQAKAWEEYLEWQSMDKNVVRRINELVKECMRHPFEGKGKPELLKSNFSGYWSRRITDEHRLVYKVKEDLITIVQCRYHYSQ